MKKKLLIVVVSFIVLIGIGGFIFYNSGIDAVDSLNHDEVVVTVEKGSGANTILNVLDEAGLIKNKLCAKIFIKLNSFDHLQANTYILNKSMSVKDIFTILEDPDFKYLLKSKVQILDGHTIPQVASRIAQYLNISDKEVLEKWSDKDYLKKLIDEYWFIDKSILDDELMYPLEGYLYPETYYVTQKNPSIESITKLSLDMMSKVLEGYKDDIEELGFTPHEFLSFVSVVERESLFDEDRPKIAGVFMNRLEEDMLLQSDITVNYAWQRTGVKVTNDHLAIDSQYNTYKYKGLPVGPISSVSKVTMEACLKYVDHDYFYFFAKEDGTVIYNKTYEDHLKSVKENLWY